MAIVAVFAVIIGVLFYFVRASRPSRRTLAHVPSFTAPRIAPYSYASPARPMLPPLPPLPEWERHLPPDLAPAGAGGSGLDYRGQLVRSHDFRSRSLSDAIFAGAELIQADFKGADLENVDFRGADLSQADFTGADLQGARFDEAHGSQTRFVGSDYEAVAGKTRVRNGITEPVPPPPVTAKNAGKASFHGARVSQVSFEAMDLAGADFSGAELSSVDFVNADLRNVNFRDSRHQLTDFRGAKVEGADFRGADLSFTRNLTAVQLASARTDERTRAPSR